MECSELDENVQRMMIYILANVAQMFEASHQLIVIDISNDVFMYILCQASIMISMDCYYSNIKIHISH